VVKREVETDVGAEPLPQEHGQLVGKRVARVGSTRAGHVAGDLHEPKLPLPAIRQPHEHRPVGPTRLFIHRGQLQKRFAAGLNHLRHEPGRTRPRSGVGRQPEIDEFPTHALKRPPQPFVALEGHAQGVAAKSEPAVESENHGREPKGLRGQPWSGAPRPGRFRRSKNAKPAAFTENSSLSIS
jgi:hypothetical protein